jgi:hypothetical protein
MRTSWSFLGGIGIIILVLTLGGPTARAAIDDPFPVDIVVSPSTLVFGSEGVWVTVHAEIPYSAVVGVSVTLDGVPVVVTKADNRGELVAKFDSGAVKSIFTGPGTYELELTGLAEDGSTFRGTDEIRVISGKVK